MKPIRVNLSNLIAFLFVAKYKSYSRASEKLHLTQPAVSMKVRALEKQFRKKLLTRENGELVLTDLGEKILELAENIYESASLCDEMLSQVKEESKGELRLGVSRTLSKFAVKYVSDFSGRFQDIKVIVREGSTRTLLKKVEDFSLDLAIVSYYPCRKRIKMIKISEEEMIFVCSSKHHLAGKEASPEDFTKEAFILPGEGSATRFLMFNVFKDANVKPRVVAEFDNPQNIKELVIQNRGISLMFPPIVEDEIKKGLISPIKFHKKILTDVYVTYIPPLSYKERLFIKLLRSESPDKQNSGYK